MAVDQIRQDVMGMMDVAREVMERGGLEEEVGTHNPRGDATIGMDVAVQEAIVEYLAGSVLPIALVSEEEAGVIDVGYGVTTELCAVVDPLDGSTNYKLGKGLRPYGTLIAVLSGQRFKDVVAAGALVHMNDTDTPWQQWVFDGEVTTDGDERPLGLAQQRWPHDINTLVQANLYQPNNHERLAPFAGKLFMTGTGCAAGNLALVLAGASAMLVDPKLKGEEAATVYGLVRGAGGLVTDFAGLPIDDTLFDPTQTYEILAGDPGAVKYAAGLLLEAASNSP